MKGDAWMTCMGFCPLSVGVSCLGPEPGPADLLAHAWFGLYLPEK